MKLSKQLLFLTRKKIPGQLVIQLTDKCNALCPQCGMRSTEKYHRTTLPVGHVKRILDTAAQHHVKAVSFTGGEPFLFFEELLCLMKYAGERGIEYIRTGTNGFFLRNANAWNFESKIKTIAHKLAQTPVRNFWISIDSSVPETHERMRGFPGVLKGIEKSLSIFHEFGIYPSANLGINRNMAPNMPAVNFSRVETGEEVTRKIFRHYKAAFRRFYRFILNMGFTMVNMCYPMSMVPENKGSALHPVYAATSPGDIVRFNATEKMLLFTALMQTVSEFRSNIRIFTPLSSLYALSLQRMNRPTAAYPCRGGIDFFFVHCRDGDTYPCGFRGNENFGKYWDMDRDTIHSNTHCFRCDWECFRDPSELFGPVLQGVSNPLGLIKKMKKNPEYFRLWRDDLRYYRACNFFNGRCAPDYKMLSKF